jgi:hypothetical protein
MEHTKPNREIEKRCLAPEWGMREDPAWDLRTEKTVGLLMSLFTGVRMLGIEGGWIKEGEGSGDVTAGEASEVDDAMRRVAGKRKVSLSAEGKGDGKKRKESKENEEIEQGQIIERAEGEGWGLGHVFQ